MMVGHGSMKNSIKEISRMITTCPSCSTEVLDRYSTCSVVASCGHFVLLHRLTAIGLANRRMFHGEDRKVRHSSIVGARL